MLHVLLLACVFVNVRIVHLGKGRVRQAGCFRAHDLSQAAEHNNKGLAVVAYEQVIYRRVFPALTSS